ncbi:TetR/AcrR family transcriptional regulator [Streptomycetaceae bacterium NBC_01309]
MPRSDQLRNRQRLLEAAREAFTEAGTEVSLAEVARRAGVGPTTLYRHFATKDDVVAALLDDLATGARAVAQRAHGIPDAWEAFALVFREGCVLGDAERALFDALARHSPAAGEQARRITAELIEPFVLGAQHGGTLRPDVTVTDVAAFMRLADSSGPPDARATAVTVLLDGLRTRPRS